MKTFNIRHKPRALIFDMDNTLYTSNFYAVHQEKVLIQCLADEKEWSPDRAQKKVDEWRKSFALENGGRKPSLGNTFLALGIPMLTSIKWRKEQIKPEKFLQRDDMLVLSISKLCPNFALAVVTNNPINIAENTLKILGIDAMFRTIIGLDSTGVSKPDTEPFRLAIKKLEIPADMCMSIGDRYEIDIEPALGLGTSGVLVDDVSDIYLLPEFLSALE